MNLMALLVGASMILGVQTKPWPFETNENYALYIRYEQDGMCSIYINQGEQRIDELEGKNAAYRISRPWRKRSVTDHRIICQMTNREGRKLSYSFVFRDRAKQGGKSAIIEMPDSQISLSLHAGRKWFEVDKKTEGTISIHRDEATGAIIKIFGKVSSVEPK